jgi:hypothetical protein
LARHPFIRQISAAFLLLLFAFSITPRKVLHDWIANHTDRIEQVTKENTVQAKINGFNCNCESLVAESPFTIASSFIEFIAPAVFAVHKDRLHCRIYTTTLFFVELRGPPVNSNPSV